MRDLHFLFMPGDFFGNYENDDDAGRRVGVCPQGQVMHG